MKAYLINLPESKDRKKYACDMLEAVGVEVKVIEAIWGKNLTYPNKQYSSLSYKLRHGKKDNYGEVGCYLSHVKALKEFLETEDEFAIICEDDISIRPEFKEVIDKAVQESKRWDILRLSGLRSGTPVEICKLDDEFSLNVNLTRQTGSGCYMVNQKAATILAKELIPMRVPLDHAYDREWLWGLKALMIYPILVNQRNGFESTIKARKHYKLPAYMRYWSVFPYRAINETSRVLYRTLQVIREKFFRR